MSEGKHENRASSATAARTLQVLWDFSERRRVSYARFLSLVVEHELRYLSSADLPAGSESKVAIDRLPDPLIRSSTGYSTSWVLDLSGWHGSKLFVYVRLGHGGVDVESASDDRDAAGIGIELIRAQLKPHEKPPADVIVCPFWSLNEGLGASMRRTRITAPAWREVELNYSMRTRHPLRQLMKAKEPGPGQLILWHGAPGTGKTSALRALLRQWSPWCAAHVVTDPEEFLAGGSYMVEVMTTDDSREPPREWKLIVLEDAGELITRDAHARTGQALSRLLNLTDGLLGQGMNTLVLVTTNEPVGKLHSAVHRPGRCWAEVEFDALPTRDANRWLSRHECEARVQRPTPIADLYALRRGDAIETEPKPEIGFGRVLSA